MTFLKRLPRRFLLSCCSLLLVVLIATPSVADGSVGSILAAANGITRVYTNPEAIQYMFDVLTASGINLSTADKQRIALRGVDASSQPAGVADIVAEKAAPTPAKYDSNTGSLAGRTGAAQVWYGSSGRGTLGVLVHSDDRGFCLKGPTLAAGVSGPAILSCFRKDAPTRVFLGEK